MPAVSLVVGKGGVGKTTCAAGLTTLFAECGDRTLLLSTDPAGSLGAVLGVPLTPGEDRAIAGLPGCAVMQLDAAAARSAFLDRWRETIITIVDRGTYLEAEDIEGLVDATFPGADEIFALITLADLMPPSAAGWDRLVVDTAPTGHTLRLLALPATFDAMISLLDAMQAKHRFMVSALTHRYRSDAADDFLAEMRSRISRMRSSLGDRAKAAALLITRAEAVVVEETRRYAAALEALQIVVGAVMVEAVGEPVSAEAQRAVADLQDIAPVLFELPRIEPPPVGVYAIRDLMSKLEIFSAKSAKREMPRGNINGVRADSGSEVSSFSGTQVRALLADSLVRSLTIVGGKGGVGKTTVACALALAAASARDHRKKILLVSTDPAPSIGDALGIADPDWARRAPQQLLGLPALDVWQMDATAAFADLRDRYRERVDELFDALMGRGVDAAHDRVIVRDLLALAPPGIDELYALSALGEVLDEHRYETLIVDPAPTGHLLRLLQMPAVALDWSHRLMRLMLKYREVAGLGDAAQELVSFSRRTRAFDQLLHDPARAGVVLVSLDEPVVLAESLRLDAALRATNVAVLGVIVNRVGGPDEGVAPTLEWPSPVIVAPESERPPTGLQAISDWCCRWRARDLAHGSE